ncbi:hypothetical protein OUZ56_014918 [Daphnia magna]|uniref:Uncharacterized protein n=1 Tax=Daphnia magna TaxID=35525 RepID=A0ABR0AL76_9CRUS|nr:hypothetical protein OUZ56_014918 [Daphnia magna]
MHRDSIAPIEFTFLCIHIVSAKWKRKIFGDDASIQFVLGIPTSDVFIDMDSKMSTPKSGDSPRSHEEAYDRLNHASFAKRNTLTP